MSLAIPVTKLNIGCGDHPLPGWLNTDLTPCRGDIFRLDATQPFPFADEAFTHIFSEHMIEHVPYEGGLSMLKECFRVLAPGGRIRISTPDLHFLISLLDPLSLIERGTARAYIEWACSIFNPSEPICGETVLNNFVRAWGHQYIYSRSMLHDSLRKVGFICITHYDIQKSADPAFIDLENDTRMPPGFLQLETMTIEAEKLNA